MFWRNHSKKYVCSVKPVMYWSVGLIHRKWTRPTVCWKAGALATSFIVQTGDVLQADHNAALNVLARLDDQEIERFTPYLKVRQILLARSPAQLSVNRLELGEQSRQPSADKSVNTF